MIIRVFNFFFSFLLSFDVKHGLRWFRRNTTKQLKVKHRSEKEYSLPLTRDAQRLSNMKKVIHLCDTNINSNHVSMIKTQRLKMPCADWTNNCAAIIVVLAVIILTSQSFNALDSLSWYSLLVMSVCCTIQQLNTETNLIWMFWDVQILLFRQLPFRLLSRVWGRACGLYVTPKFRPYLYQFYTKFYGVNSEELLITDLTYYKTLGEFFCRKLQPELRPISARAQVVSPVDGAVVHCGALFDGTVKRVKGIDYSIVKFLGPRDTTCNKPIRSFVEDLMVNPSKNHLYSCVIYLAAGDYHRFHSPCDWTMKCRRHFVGDLLTVNPIFLSWIPDLFVLNERVVLSGKWDHGFFSMTAVGATNVGSIVVHGDEHLQTNVPYAVKETYIDRDFTNGGITHAKGNEVGMFKLGSTVVLIFEAPKDAVFSHKPGKKIKYGEALMTF